MATNYEELAKKRNKEEREKKLKLKYQFLEKEREANSKLTKKQLEEKRAKHTFDGRLSYDSLDKEYKKREREWIKQQMSK